MITFGSGHRSWISEMSSFHVGALSSNLDGCDPSLDFLLRIGIRNQPENNHRVLSDPVLEAYLTLLFLVVRDQSGEIPSGDFDTSQDDQTGHPMPDPFKT